MSCEQPKDAATGAATAGNAATSGNAALTARDTLFRWEISRRQLVVIAGGGAAVLALAGTYSVAATDSTPVTSPFWRVRVVRAGRGARLTTAGLPAFHAAPGPSLFTSKPSPAVVGKSAGLSGAHPDGHSGRPEGESSGSSAAMSNPQPANLTWGDVVILEVEVLNTTAAPMLFSPGQLRLKLAGGQTITPEDASRSPGAFAAGSPEMLWVSYLAPSDAADFSVEFTDPQQDAQLTLGVPRLVTARGRA
jgi:hypothetical protein